MIALLLAAILVTLLGAWALVFWITATWVLYVGVVAVLGAPVLAWCAWCEVRLDRRRQVAGVPPEPKP